MRPVTFSLIIALLLAGCTVPVQTSDGDQNEREISLGASQTSILRGADRIRAGGMGTATAAGAGNVVSAGAGNVVSAGGGNVTGDQLAETAPLIGGAGGNVISAGGGNLTMSAELALTPDRRPRGKTPEGLECDPFVPSGLPGTLTGTLEAPGELIGVASGTVPVTRAPVGLYAIDGTLLAETVSSGEAGAFTFEAVPQQEILVARSLVRVGDRTLYLSSLVQLDAAAGSVELDPVSTVMEAKYLARAAGTTPVRGSFVWSRWLAVKALAGAPAVPLAVIEAGTSIASRAAHYDAWGIKDGLDTWDLRTAPCRDTAGDEQ